MPVTTKHPEYIRFLNKWERCRDAVEGEDAIKAKGGEISSGLKLARNLKYLKHQKAAEEGVNSTETEIMKGINSTCFLGTRLSGRYWWKGFQGWIFRKKAPNYLLGSPEFNGGLP